MFSNRFSSTSLDPSVQLFGKEVELTDEYKDPIPNNSHFLNAQIEYDEFAESRFILIN